MSITIPKHLDALDYGQLTRLEGEIARLKDRQYQDLKSKVATMADEARQRWTAYANKFGLQPEHVPVVMAPAGNGHAKAPKRAVRKSGGIKVKYRDPSNAENTWSGRGRPARWLAALERQGKRREDFRVSA